MYTAAAKAQGQEYHNKYVKILINSTARTRHHISQLSLAVLYMWIKNYLSSREVCSRSNWQADTK